MQNFTIGCSTHAVRYFWAISPACWHMMSHVSRHLAQPVCFAQPKNPGCRGESCAELTLSPIVPPWFVTMSWRNVFRIFIWKLIFSPTYYAICDWHILLTKKNIPLGQTVGRRSKNWLIKNNSRWAEFALIWAYNIFFIVFCTWPHSNVQ